MNEIKIIGKINELLYTATDHAVGGLIKCSPTSLITGGPAVFSTA